MMTYPGTPRQRRPSGLAAALAAYKNPAGSLAPTSPASGSGRLTSSLSSGARTGGQNPGLAFAPGTVSASPSSAPDFRSLLSLVQQVQAAKAAKRDSQSSLVQSLVSGGSLDGLAGPAPAWVKPNGRGITYTGQSFTHQTDGLPGYPAVDLFAPAGTPFLAPENGRIIRISGHPGTTSGNVFGQSIYFQGVSGRTYFITHLGTVAPMGSYKRGAPIGTVSRWTSGSSHAHVGVHGGGRRR